MTAPDDARPAEVTATPSAGRGPADHSRNTRLRTVSYGGGVQSTSLLVLAARHDIDFPVFLFADVGADTENPGTIRYVADHAVPYAKANGIDLHILERVRRDGTTDTIRQRIMKPGGKSQLIPVRSTRDGPPLSRSCTVTFKIEVLGRWLKEHGAGPDNPATVAVGISLDEVHRANRTPRPYEHIVYPLLDLRLRRTDCVRIIASAGLPIPPKSSCYFCPHTKLPQWLEMRRTEPELFDDAVLIERTLTEKAGHPVYLTRFGAPLDVVVPEGMDLLPFLDEGDGACMDGVCAT